MAPLTMALKKLTLSHKEKNAGNLLVNNHVCFCMFVHTYPLHWLIRSILSHAWSAERERN